MLCAVGELTTAAPTTTTTSESTSHAYSTDGTSRTVTRRVAASTTHGITTSTSTSADISQPSIVVDTGMSMTR